MREDIKITNEADRIIRRIYFKEGNIMYDCEKYSHSQIYPFMENIGPKDLDDYLQEVISKRRFLADGALSPEKSDWASALFEPIKRIAEFHGHRTIMAELALIPDQRIPNADNVSFASFLAVSDNFSNQNEEICETYSQAMSDMKDGHAIVTHPNLYVSIDKEEENSCFIIKRGDEEGPSNRQDAISDENLSCSRIIIYSNNDIEPHSSSSIEDRATLFAKRFTERLKNSDIDKDFIGQIQRSTLMLHPIIRSGFSSAVEYNSKAGYRNSAGGVLFLWIIPQHDKANWAPFIRDINHYYLLSNRDGSYARINSISVQNKTHKYALWAFSHHIKNSLNESYIPQLRNEFPGEDVITKHLKCLDYVRSTSGAINFSKALSQGIDILSESQKTRITRLMEGCEKESRSARKSFSDIVTTLIQHRLDYLSGQYDVEFFEHMNTDSDMNCEYCAQRNGWPFDRGYDDEGKGLAVAIGLMEQVRNITDYIVRSGVRNPLQTYCVSVETDNKKITVRQRYPVKKGINVKSDTLEKVQHLERDFICDTSGRQICHTRQAVIIPLDVGRRHQVSECIWEFYYTALLNNR